LGLGTIPANKNDLEAALVASPAIHPTETLSTTGTENEPLLNPFGRVHEMVGMDIANQYFTTALDEELEKIKAFYSKTEKELVDELFRLITEITNVERQEETYLHSLWRETPRDVPEQIDTLSSRRVNVGVSALDSWDTRIVNNVENERPVSTTIDTSRPGFLPYLMWSSNSLSVIRQQFIKKVTGLFVTFCELQNYVEINKTGFSKVLKKFEKVLGSKIKSEYLTVVEEQYPFLQSTKTRLGDAIEKLIQWYARIATDGKVVLAQIELKSHLREHIVWERNTIWRDMVEQERRRETIGFVSNDIGRDGIQSKTVTIHICGFPFIFPKEIPSNVIVIVFAILVLILVCQSSIFPTVAQNNCLGILLFASILWALEALPLFVTSLIVPFLVVSLRVMIKDGIRLDAKSTAKLIFSDMFGPVIMLLLGGFSLAAALSKHNIAKSMASFILEKAGTKPYAVLLANMFVSTFASMWISNVAAPVLCFSLITPILRNLPQRSPYARCLVIGIAMAANVGGMASPIASPQNAISMGIMNPPPSWGEWFAIAIPICICLDLCIWAVLLAVYRPSEMNIAPPELFARQETDRRLSGKQWYILIVTGCTIAMWCVESTIENIIGDMGVIAIFPIFAFYGAGILTKDDWNSMLWSVVMLAMGGIALGKAVESSGLLHEITGHLTPLLQDMSVFSCLALLAGVVVIVTSFISHTVGALIILPVVAQIGALLPDPRPRTLVMTAGIFNLI
jgi:phosphate transporter